MTLKRVTALFIAAAFIFALAAPVSADDSLPTETPPLTDSSAPPHPLIAVLSAYFGDLLPAPVDGQPPLSDQIAALHADGMGFGVMVKFYAIAAESKAFCEGQTDCTPVTVEELISAFKSGAGIGALFKEHGKPATVGVGQLKNDNKGKGKNK